MPAPVQLSHEASDIETGSGGGLGVCKVALDLSHSYVTSHACPLLPDKLPRKLCRGMGQKGWPVAMRQEWGEGSKRNSGGISKLEGWDT